MRDHVTLQTGTTIADCQEKLAQFCQEDNSYKSYDLSPDVQEDDQLTEKDVRLANFIVARMSARVVGSVLDRVEAIDSALSQIPPRTSISDVVISWAAMTQLFSATLGPDIGPARATKILHKKRPALIPILDSVVESYCKKACGEDLRGRDTASKMVAYTKAVKKDIDANLDVLESVIQAGDLKLTPVRAFDILLWAYSGEYEGRFGNSPVWKR